MQAWLDTLIAQTSWMQEVPRGFIYTAGMLGAVTPEVPGAPVHTAAVSVVDRVVDPASSTFGVRLELPNPDHSIPGGLRCRVRFLADGGDEPANAAGN